MMFEPKRVALRDAEATVASLEADDRERERKLSADRTNGEKLKAENQRQLDRLAQQRVAEDSAHERALKTIADCRMSPDPTCYTERSRAEDARYKEAKEHLAADEARIAEAMASRDATTATTPPVDMTAANRAASEARAAYAVALGGNQIYRLAGMVYGVPPEHITDSQITAARGFFSFFTACVIAMAGMISALIHYWPNNEISSSRLLRSLRAYIARLRKDIVVTRTVEVEKIVPLVEKPVLIVRERTTHIPYTGTGALPVDKIAETRTEGAPAVAALAEAHARNHAHLREVR